MAISAYVGIPGSGKSYEVVSNVIIPAFMKGRRVVSNIYGLQVEKIREFCIKEKKAREEDFGEIIVVSHEEVKKDDFFPYMQGDMIFPDSFCKAGDLICIDEVWSVWGSDNEIPKNHRSFIAEHRHFASVTGITCDVVVMNQSVAGLPRFLKDRIESTFKMSKHISLGMNNRYRVDIYTGIKLFKTNLSTSYQCKYDRRIFPLYESHVGGAGNEQSVDGRANILTQKKFWVYAVIILLLFIWSVINVIKFFSGESMGVNKSPPESSQLPAPENTASKAPGKAQAASDEAVSAKWRIAGRIRTGGRMYVILSDTTGRLRTEFMTQFTYDSMMSSGIVDGEKVTVYSGSLQ